MKKKGLEAIRVIDLTTAGIGPIASEYLALAGMEVIRIEKPSAKEASRADRCAFIANNLNKKCMYLDYETDAGREQLMKLIGRADVLIENLSFADIDRLNLTYEALKVQYPRLIVVSIKPYSRGSHWADCPVSESIMHAVSGPTYLCGYPDEEPVAPGVNLADTDTCAFAASGATAALIQREVTGEGQLVEVSVQEAVIAHTRSAYEMYHEYGLNARAGNGFPYFREMAPWNLYRSKGDDPATDWVIIGCRNDSAFEKFCQVIGREDMIIDPRYCNSAARQAHLPELDAEVTKWTSQYDKYEIMDILLRKNRITSGAVRSIGEIIADEDLRRLGIIQKVDDPELGEMWLPAYPSLASGLNIKAKPPRWISVEGGAEND